MPASQLPPSQLPLPLAQPHNNQQLFSDYYLNKILPLNPAWLLLTEPVAAAKQAVAAIFHAYAPSSNEAQTEDDLVKPLLKALGHLFEVQPSLKVPGSVNKPDYVFYRDVDALNANKGHTLTDSLPGQGAYAVGDAKYWERPLDVTLKSKSSDNSKDALSNKNPSFQIAFYMQHSSVEWGILTNGRLWRLYHKDTAHKLDRYYEIDLPALLESGSDADFLYFFAFFRRDAFLGTTLNLRDLLRASIEFARDIGDSLKAQVYDALLHIAQGFLDFAPNRLQTDPSALKAIYDNALIVLYRLLFILYAEDRNLLPAHEPGEYKDTYSLHAIKTGVARNLDAGKTLLPDSTRLWAQLQDLFRIIDRGAEKIGVDVYNGGLFDPQKHPFAERYKVGDARLERAIDKLTRVNKQFVDYRDLSPRHLGTIYEGLLEFHLSVSELEGKGKREEGKENSPEHLNTGFTLSLRNDKGERKATGSYYTPDYIVKYIVEATLSPLLDRATRNIVENGTDNQAEKDPEDKNDGRTEDAERIEAVLGIRVLDPAMGSGHFLVEAAETIARYLVDMGVAPPEVTAEEADLAYWKRRVVQSCIYGVDLNPLAVELAKLSLWLTTVAKDRPLSFLDHHLRPGNALVGGRLAALQNVTQLRIAGNGAKKPTPSRKQTERTKQEQAGQISMLADDAFRLSMTGAVVKMWDIDFVEANNVSQVKRQEELYHELRDELTGKYGRLADLVTATHFGVSFDAGFWPELADFATGRALALRPELADKLTQAESLARRYGFFHWELEFPEVFFGRNGEPLGDASGFDAVVGNPPYIRQEQLAPFKPFLMANYAGFHGVADLYLFFFEQGLNMTRTGGRMGFISSGTFARANFAVPFRQWLPTVAHIDTLVDFGENQPFAGAEMVRPSIMLLRKGLQQAAFRSLFLADNVPASLETAVREQGIDCDPAALQQSEWTFQPKSDTRLFEKIQRTGRKLVDVVDGKMYYGVKTGLNEAFIIDQQTRDRLVKENASIIKPMLRGEDLRPWYQEDEGRYLITFPNGWTRQTFNAGLSEAEAWERLCTNYPAITQHLAPFAEAARQRTDKGQYWWELRSCDYYPAFEQPKVFWPDIAKLPRFSYDTEGKYVNDKGYIISCDNYWLLGILQSRVSWFAVSQTCVPLRLRAGLWQYQMKSQFITRLPIPDASDADRAAIGQLARSLTEQARARYALHRKTRHRLLSDLGDPGRALNQKLTAWYALTFPSLRAELQKVFKRDIPLRDRDDWEAYLAASRAEHAARTAEIIRLETELNARVYALFALTDAEIQTLEASVRYAYGEV